MSSYIPFQINFGTGGLDLFHPPDVISQGKLARLTNVEMRQAGSFAGRPGQTQLFSTPPQTEIHSIARVNSGVGAATFSRVVGAGTGLFCGVSGVLAQIDSGYSGNPLTVVPLRPPISGEAWAYIGDSAKMAKVRASDCLVTSIGLTRAVTIGGRLRIDEFARTPDGVISAADRSRLVNVGFDIAQGGSGTSTFVTLAAEKTLPIDTCETAGWTNNTGSGAGAPSNATDSDHKAGTSSVKFTTNGGANAYYQFWAKANVLNLSVFSDGLTQATDDDIIHMWFKVDRPDLVQELRIYFVCSPVFDLATVPGSSATLNTDAYMKSVRPSDFTSLYEATLVTLPAAASYNATAQTLGRLTGITDNRTLTALLKQQNESIRALTLQLAPGRAQWSEFGAIGIPLYRGDFRRIGSSTSAGWSTVTGVIILAQVASSNINIWLDDIYMRGGYGPDTSVIGAQSYDYRYRHYDPRTGAKSNPSNDTGGYFAVDPLRQAVVLTPQAYGDSNIRQQFFRRGGALVSNWYYLGMNTSDGGSFTDIFTDDQLKAADILELDNDQPVTTVDSSGNTVYASPLPSIWGPILDVLMGCGDPYRKGYLYWSKQTQYDHWPIANSAEVCSPAEELMAGCVFLGQGYVFSRLRCFNCYVHLGGGGAFVPTPTACKHGLISRWGLAVGMDGMYFVSNDGIYHTSGSLEDSITDPDLFALFHGESRGGYLPVDFTHPEAIRLEIHLNELWFVYRDTGGTNRVLIYSMLYKFWRAYTFGREVSSLAGETQAQDQPMLLLGGRTTGICYTYSGTSDDGLAISGNIRTGSYNQGYQRPDKQYGDITLELDRAGASITLTPYANAASIALQAQVINSGVGRTQYQFDPIDGSGNPGPYLARDLALDLSWSTLLAPPVFYTAGVAALVQPDDTAGRVTDWESSGVADKLVKGVVLEVDTAGASKTVNIEGDGGFQTSIIVQASGRQVLEFSWTEFKSRLLRLRPLGSSTWKLYSYRWIFDEEPLSLTRWETQPQDHRITAPGGQSILYADILLSSTTPVTLQVTAYQRDGSSSILTSIPSPIPSTGGAKQKIFVAFASNKAVLFRYVFTSSSPFFLYREESSVAVQPWGGSLTMAKPFGNDDLDPVRSMVNAQAAAARSSYVLR